jgi:hypothetical protein
MTTLLILAVMAGVLMVLVVLIIYLVDRFNGLERQTQDLMRRLQDSQSKPNVGPYAGLSGKPLWDALTAASEAPIDELVLDGVRKRYRLILGDHVQWVFNEGVSDVGKGFDKVPANTRTMRTPKAQVESWLPPEAVAEIYGCGQGYGIGDPTELPAQRRRLDQVVAQLHTQCMLEVLQPASSLLMPPLPAEAAAAVAPSPAGPAAIQAPSP